MAMPVQSHPLSPSEPPSISRIARQRPSRASESNDTRAVSGYFALKLQSDERAAASNDLVDAHATIKPANRRPSLSIIANSSGNDDHPTIRVNGQDFSKNRNNYQALALGRDAEDPPLFSPSSFISQENTTVVISTKWHELTDEEIRSVAVGITQPSTSSDPAANVYIAVIRQLSRHIENITGPQQTKKGGLKKVTSRPQKPTTPVKDPSPSVVEQPVDMPINKPVEEEPSVQPPHLQVSDALSEAMADTLSPPVMSTKPLDRIPSQSTILSNTDAASIIQSVYSGEQDGNDKSSMKSRSSGKSKDSRYKSISGMSDWMGGWWRDKGSVKSRGHGDDSDGERTPSPEGDDTEREIRRPSGRRQTRKSFAVTSWFAPSPATAVQAATVSGPSASTSNSTSTSPTRQKPKRRNLSVTVSAGPASPTSPFTAQFQPVPTSVPPPTIAPHIDTPPEGVSVKSTALAQEAQLLAAPPTDPHPSHIKAIFYATRVMTSDPGSVLQDGGLNTAPLIADLAHALVENMKNDPGFKLREGRIGPKISNPPSAVFPSSSSTVSAPALAVAQIEKSESTAKIVSNLSSLVAGPRASVAALKAPLKASLKGPLMASFKAKPLMDVAKSTVGSNSQSNSASTNPGGPNPKTRTLELESIVPEQARPPTLYLSRTYTSFVADPNFKPSVFPSAPSRFSLSISRLERKPELHTDRFGFIYDVTVYDAFILAEAHKAKNTAPACLTGVRIADREAETEDEDWWPSYEGELPPSGRKLKLEVSIEPCRCKDGIFEVDERPAGSSSADPNVFSGNSTDPDITNVDGTNDGEERPAINLTEALVTSSQEAKPASETPSTEVPNHVCSNTVRFLLSELTSLHDQKQKAQKGEWDSLLRKIHQVKEPSSTQAVAQAVLAQASSSAAAMLGFAKTSDTVESEDEESKLTTGVGFAQLSSNKDDWREFFKLVVRGIPLVHRSKVWFECSGALELSEPGVFRDLESQARIIAEKMNTPMNAGSEQGNLEKHIATEEIEKDVTRTMPLNIFFGGDGQGVDKLRAVLRAYSLRNPAVGYCQGMNLVASTLLLVLADKEEAFWVFCAIIERVLPSDFFSPSLLVSRACPMILMDYVQDHLPKLFAHLTNIGIDLPAICFSWFLSLFTDCLPVETLFRVWDVLICDKNGMDVLFRVSLAILKIGEEELLRCHSMSSLYSVLESLPCRMWDADKLLKLQEELRSTILHDDLVKRRAMHVDALSTSQRT